MLTSLVLFTLAASLSLAVPGLPAPDESTDLSLRVIASIPTIKTRRSPLEPDSGPAITMTPLGKDLTSFPTTSSSLPPCDHGAWLHEPGPWWEPEETNLPIGEVQPVPTLCSEPPHRVLEAAESIEMTALKKDVATVRCPAPYC